MADDEFEVTSVFKEELEMDQENQEEQEETLDEPDYSQHNPEMSMNEYMSGNRDLYRLMDFFYSNSVAFFSKENEVTVEDENEDKEGEDPNSNEPQDDTGSDNVKDKEKVENSSESEAHYNNNLYLII